MPVGGIDLIRPTYLDEGSCQGLTQWQGLSTELLMPASPTESYLGIFFLFGASDFILSQARRIFELMIIDAGL